MEENFSQQSLIESGSLQKDDLANNNDTLISTKKKTLKVLQFGSGDINDVRLDDDSILDNLGKRKLNIALMNSSLLMTRLIAGCISLSLYGRISLNLSMLLLGMI